MKKGSIEHQDWHSVIVAVVVVACILSTVLIASYYNNRKEAVRKISECKFKLRENADARRTYMATAPEFTQSAHLRKVIDSLMLVDDSLDLKKNQRLVSRLEDIAKYDDSIATSRLAQFDTIQNRLKREMQKYQNKLK
ncbi:MAG: hypothetical protein J6T27_03370 [Alphaproteobacteria bacterium]|nr:hypothetical protein [Alphaproteobacteria bacterium]